MSEGSRMISTTRSGHFEPDLRMSGPRTQIHLPVQEGGRWRSRRATPTPNLPPLGGGSAPSVWQHLRGRTRSTGDFSGVWRCLLAIMALLVAITAGNPAAADPVADFYKGREL